MTSAAKGINAIEGKNVIIIIIFNFEDVRVLLQQECDRPSSSKNVQKPIVPSVILVTPET